MTRQALGLRCVLLTVVALIAIALPSAPSAPHHWLRYPAVLDLESGTTTRLGDVDDIISAAAWSPDGSSVIYGSRSGLLRIDLTDGGRRFLTEHPSHSPSFSPDGDRLLYMQGDQFGGRLAILDVDSGDVETLDQGGRSPSWSPDGDEIAYVVFHSGSAGEWGELRVLDVTTGDERSLVERMAPYSDIDWAPHDDRIAYVDSYQVHVDGGEDHWIHMGSYQVHTIESDGSGDRAFDGSGDANDSPVWSPDGDRIAAGGGNLTVYDAATGTYDVIHEGPAGALDWSPDGTRLASVAAPADWRDEDEYQLVVMDADGGDKTFFRFGQQVSGGRWSPEGDELAVIESVTGEHPARVVETSMTIERYESERRVGLRGLVQSEHEQCQARAVTVKKVRPGRDRVVFRDATWPDHRYEAGPFFGWVPTKSRGWFYAVATEKRFTEEDTTPVTCLRARSGRTYLNGKS